MITETSERASRRLIEVNTDSDKWIQNTDSDRLIQPVTCAV